MEIFLLEKNFIPPKTLGKRAVFKGVLLMGCFAKLSG
jgi:hypothetical protein